MEAGQSGRGYGSVYKRHGDRGLLRTRHYRLRYRTCGLADGLSRTGVGGSDDDGGPVATVTYGEVCGTIAAIGRNVRRRFGALAQSRVLARYGVGFCVLFSQVATFTYVTFYLAAPPFNLRPALLGLVFVVYLIGAAATPMAGWWVDRVGPRATLKLAAMLGMMGVLLTTEARIWAVAAGLSIECSAVFIAQSAISRSLGQCATEYRGVAVGLYATSYYLGGSVGATLPAYAWALGRWPGCVAVILLAQCATFGIAQWLWAVPQETL